MDINPYAPATPLRQHELATGPTDRPVRFGGVVRRVDVTRLRYSPLGTVVSTMLLIIGSLTCAFLLLALILGTSTSAASTPTAASFVVVLGVMVFPLVLLPLWLLSRFRGKGYARLLEKLSPRIVGPVDGKLEQETLEFVYPYSRTVIPLQSLTGVRTSCEFIALSYDHRQLQMCVLPRHLFEHDDFLRATERLAPLATQRPLRTTRQPGLDSRLWEGEPLELIPMPSGAVTFSGTLVFSDFASTPVYREQMRTVYFFFAKLAVLAVVAMLLVAAVFWDEKQFLYTFSAASLGVFLFGVARWALAFKRNVPSRNHPVANVSGWLTEHGLTYNTAIGSSILQLHAFQRIDVDEHSIQLILPGHFRPAVLLVDRMFKSPDDFQRVRRWAEATAG